MISFVFNMTSMRLIKWNSKYFQSYFDIAMGWLTYEVTRYMIVIYSRVFC